MNANVELLMREEARKLARRNGQAVVPLVRNNSNWYTRRTSYFKYDEETAHLTGDYGNPPRNFFTPAAATDDLQCDNKYGVYTRIGVAGETAPHEWTIKGLVQDQNDQLPYEANFVLRCSRALCNRIMCTDCGNHSDRCECDGIHPRELPITTDPADIEATIVVSTGVVPTSEPRLQEETVPGVRSDHYIDHGDDNCPGFPQCFHGHGIEGEVSDNEDLWTTCSVHDEEDGWSDVGQTHQQTTPEDPQHSEPKRRMTRASEAARLVADQRIYKDWEHIPVYNLSTDDKFSYIENYLIK